MCLLDGPEDVFRMSCEEVLVRWSQRLEFSDQGSMPFHVQMQFRLVNQYNSRSVVRVPPNQKKSGDDLLLAGAKAVKCEGRTTAERLDTKVNSIVRKWSQIPYHAPCITAHQAIDYIDSAISLGLVNALEQPRLAHERAEYLKLKATSAVAVGAASRVKMPRVGVFHHRPQFRVASCTFR